jgi:hypothetical protein
MIDVWRRFHPDSNQFTYWGNQATKPKSRLDRIYISENWLHQKHSAQICPWFKLNLNPTRFPVMTPFYASALEAWYNMKPIVNSDLQYLEDLRRTPLRNSTLLTPHISGHTLGFDEAWSTLNIYYVGELLMVNGRWKELKDINTTQCTKPTFRRLTANIRTAEAFLATTTRTYCRRAPP